MKQTPSNPPKRAIKFFSWYCRNHLHDSILGDLEALDELKRKMDELDIQIPVIFITAHDDEKTWQQVDEFKSKGLQKPFDEKELLEVSRGHVKEVMTVLDKLN